MRRNWNMIWDILTRSEGVTGEKEVLFPSDFKGLDPKVVGYHVALLRDAGFLDADYSRNKRTGEVENFTIYGLTWAGHEALEAFRSSWSSWKGVGIVPSIDMVFKTKQTVREFFDDPKLIRRTKVDAPL